MRALLIMAALLLAAAPAAHADGPGGGPGGGGGSGGPGGGMGGPSGGELSGGSHGPSGGSRNSGMPPVEQQPSPEAVPDQDKALEAVRSAGALPLDQIIATARHLTNGEIVDAKLTSRDGSLLYRLKVLETSGEVRAFYFYAQSGQLFRIE